MLRHFAQKSKERTIEGKVAKMSLLVFNGGGDKIWNMSGDVQFDEENSHAPSVQFSVESKPSVFIQLVLKTGMATTKRQAEIILAVFVVLALIFVCWFFLFGVGGKAKPLTNNQIEQIIKNQQGAQAPHY